MACASQSILKCKLCNNFMKQPKILVKCKDSFCLSCLKEHCENKSPGSKISCPSQSCEQIFFIPKGGLEQLPDNDFVVRSLAHLNVTEGPSSDICSLHMSENIIAFCETCKKGACNLCLIDHSGHQFLKLEDLKNKITDEIMFNILEVQEFDISLKKTLFEINANQQKFENRILSLEDEITSKGDEIKKKVDDKVSELLSHLASYKDDILRRNIFCNTEIVDNKAKITTLLKECESVLNHKSSFYAICSMIQLAPKLKEACKVKPNISKVECKMSFYPEDQNFDPAVGSLIIEESKNEIELEESVKLVIHEKFPDDLDIQVCLAYGDRLFCISSLSNEIYIYDREPLKFEKKIKIHGLLCPTSMVATCNCLFVCNCSDCTLSIFRIDLFTCKVPFAWSTLAQFGKISLSEDEDDSIILCTNDPNMLIEYSLEGKMQCKFELDMLCNPQHALKIGNRFIVCGSGSKDVLFMIDSNGNVLKTFPSSGGGLVTELRFPCHLLKCSNSDVFVFDSCNGRILLFQDDFVLIREINFDVEIFCNKTCGSFDKSGKLYLSNTADNSVYIFDLQNVWSSN